MSHFGKHFVAIIGGSVAGSEAAFLLAEKGYRVVVFDQKALPYGKIEDGLPNWHVGLRDKEEAAIDKRLNHDNVRYVPGFTLGKDAKLEDLLNEWGFSVVIIAIGAWHDRAIDIEGIDKYYNNGIVKQNDLVYWFNHKHEPDYKGPSYHIENNTAVVGGGLASLDMVKISMIELAQKALKKHKGVEVDLFTLEKNGISKILGQYDTSLEELGVEPCTLFYRRDAEDMPLYPRKDSTSEGEAKARRVSKKLLENYVDKFLFKFEPRCTPKSIIEKGGKFKGMVFQKLDIQEGKLVEVEGQTIEFYTDLVISSIGSLPKETPSLPIAGNMLKTYGDLGSRVEGFENVFAVGNVVTGRGNILESRKHGRQTTDKIIDEHLDPMIKDDSMTEKYEEIFRNIESDVEKKINDIASTISNEPVHSNEDIENILSRTRELQKRAGFDGNYMNWIAKNRPVRLENMIL
jgi:NADPH-dependent glutamate synthase beta subunit-like oxidoreductase